VDIRVTTIMHSEFCEKENLVLNSNWWRFRTMD